MKIDKPPVCQKLLQNGKKYRLISEPEAEITPEVDTVENQLGVAVGGVCRFLRYSILKIFKNNANCSPFLFPSV